MKCRLVLCWLICVFSANIKSFADDQSLPSGSGNYVVIGAFAVEAHARIWINKAKKSNLTAVSELNRSRKLYYVYVTKTDDRPAAFAEAEKLRKDSPFWDTWVFAGSMTSEALDAGTDTNPLTKQTITSVESKNPFGGGATGTSKGNEPAGTDKTSPLISDVEKKDSVVVAKPTIDNNSGTAEPGAKVFLFKIEGAEEHNALVGKIDIIDVDRARKAGSYAGNKDVLVNPPNKSGHVSAVCQVFGYRPFHRNFNFFNPSDSGGVVIDTSRITMPFELVRLKKGDFAVMYNVYFFKDAAVMRPESKYEVTSLLNMMKENPKYKIRIHGHTNGNAAGKVVSMGESTNFFSLNGTSEGFGSAKKLSEERAKMMKHYLVHQGISEHRMEIKAWGGKHPVYDKLSPQAQANVRVEIEIIEDK